jgi:hypothetical protein
MGVAVDWVPTRTRLFPLVAAFIQLQVSPGWYPVRKCHKGSELSAGAEFFDVFVRPPRIRDVNADSGSL